MHTEDTEHHLLVSKPDLESTAHYLIVLGKGSLSIQLPW